MDFKEKDVIGMNGNRYRILGMRQGIVSVIQLNTTQIVILLWTCEEICGWIADGRAIVENFISTDAVADCSYLSGQSSKKYDRNKILVDSIVSEYGPLYEQFIIRTEKRALQEAFDKAQISKATGWRIIREYLQSGFDYSVLAPKSHMIVNKTCGKKRGPHQTGESPDTLPLSDSLQAIMEQYRTLYLHTHDMTVIAAYRKMLGEKFAKEVAAGSGFPSERRFRLYIHRHTTQNEIAIAKKGARECYNNLRLTMSDCMNGVMGPGDVYEIDENEMDVMILSQHIQGMIIGRPILYLMTDVFSRMIVAYYIGYDNNSCEGAAHCLLNILDDKCGVCRKYALPVMPGDWPANYLPNRIRSDYGAEYTSYGMERIFNENGIAHEVVTPGVGSMKGVVEQLFHEIQTAIRPFIEHKGGISSRHDSDHYDTAVLTMDEMENIVLQHILLHNRKYMEAYPLTSSMKNAGIQPIPKELWAFGVQECGNPRVIGNLDMFRFSLLLPVKAKISRQGITYKGLFYWSEADPRLPDMAFAAGSKMVQFENARIDPRCIDRLFYIDAYGHLRWASLNLRKAGMRDYLGYTLKEYEAWRKRKSQMDSRGRFDNMRRSAAVTQRTTAVIEEAQAQRGIRLDKQSKKNIRANRASEKTLHDKDYTVFGEEMPMDTMRAADSKEKDDKSVSIPEEIDIDENFSMVEAGDIMARRIYIKEEEDI